ncbi:MAG: hypothetical protein ACXWCQ_35005, partial [Burkholderiales bacterium]
ADDFVALMRSLSEDSLSHAGLALTLTTLTDFVLDSRDSAEDWAETERMHRAMVAVTRAKGMESLAKTLETGL